MKPLIIHLLTAGALAILTLALPACKSESATQKAEAASDNTACKRLVSLDGAITEALFELELGKCIVGVDVTSTYPAEGLANAAHLGHVSRLNAEAILQLKPDLLLVIDTEKENVIIRQLQDAGVECLFVPKTYRSETPLEIATAISGKLGHEEKLAALQSRLESDRNALDAALKGATDKPRVLFIYARGKGNLMVAGRNTAAESMIALAGGQNALTDFEDFRALSTEGLVQAKPDYILMFDSGLQSLDGADGLLTIPGIAQTPAGKNKRIITMEGQYLLGFGPRCLQAARELAVQIHKQKGENI